VCAAEGEALDTKMIEVLMDECREEIDKSSKSDNVRYGPPR
jgi:hypothetical protein